LHLDLTNLFSFYNADTNEEKMKELFAAHGKVEKVNLPTNKNTGQPRGFAFVDMATNAELEAAIAALDGQQFEGRVLRVSKSVPKEQQEKKQDENIGKIYVGNLPFTATKDAVMNFFSEYAEIVELYLPMNPETGEARGFAFVTVKEEDVDATIEKTSGLDFEGRALTVNKPLPPGKKSAKKPPGSQQQQVRGDRTKIYVGNLSFYTVPDTLYQVFEEFGTVHDCYFPEDTETGGSRGFAFITMDKEAAMNAINEIDGCELDGRMIRVNEAQPKGSGGGRKQPSRDESSSSEE
jgi:RNA recognition motif-containing protein